mgnify:CR=1 FL=1
MSETPQLDASQIHNLREALHLQFPNGPLWVDTLCDMALALSAAEQRAEAMGDRANNLFGALLEFHNAFCNRGETTSLHDWNERMKRADEHACQVLPIAIASGAGESKGVAIFVAEALAQHHFTVSLSRKNTRP